MIVIATPTGQIGRQVLAGVLDHVQSGVGVHAGVGMHAGVGVHAGAGAPAGVGVPAGAGDQAGVPAGALDRVVEGAVPVRVIARDPARLPAEVRERVEIVRGSADDLGTVNAALAGADSVFWLVPPNPRAASVQEHVLDFVRPLCDAINNHGITRVVAVSSLGRGTARNAGQISAIFAMDDLIESTGVSYRSLCPPGFMENMLWQVEQIRGRGVFTLPMPGDRKRPTCATRDIASTAVALLLDQSWTGQDSVPVLGPEDLSCDDEARIMSEVLGRQIRFERVPAEVHKATLMRHGMSGAWAQGIVDMAAAVDRGAYDAVPRNTPPRTPGSTTPTSFRQWCEEVLKPAVLAVPQQ